MLLPTTSDGMSLIELLVAVAVGALLMTLLNNVLGGVQAGWRKTGVSASTSNEELAGAQFLFASLSAALPPDPTDQNTWFRGTSDRIEFLSVPPAADAFRGPVKIRLYATPQENGQKRLVVEMLALGQSRDTQASRSPDVRYILNGLESVSFRFSELRGGLLQEAESWNDPSQLPKLISMNISFMDKTVKPLRLAIAPRRTISGRCNFDLVGLSCRI